VTMSEYDFLTIAEFDDETDIVCALMVASPQALDAWHKVR
jgi:hypothetical protein